MDFRKKNHKKCILLISLVLLMLILNLDNIQKFLDSNELSTVGDPLARITPEELRFNPPGIYYYIWIVEQLTDNIFMLRFSIMIFGIFTVMVLFSFLDKEAGINWATISCLVFIFVYSSNGIFTNIQPYISFTFFSLLSRIFLYRFYVKKDNRQLVFYVLFMAVSLFFNYFTYFLIIADSIFFFLHFLKKKETTYLYIIATLFLMQAPYMPHIINGLLTRGESYPPSPVTSIYFWILMSFFLIHFIPSILMLLLNKNKASRKVFDSPNFIFYSLIIILSTFLSYSKTVYFLHILPSFLVSLNLFKPSVKIRNLFNKKYFSTIIILVLLFTAISFSSLEAIYSNSPNLDELMTLIKEDNAPNATINSFDEPNYWFLVENVEFNLLGKELNLQNIKSLHRKYKDYYVFMINNITVKLNRVLCNETLRKGYYIYPTIIVDPAIRAQKCNLDFWDKCDPIEGIRDLYYCTGPPS